MWKRDKEDGLGTPEAQSAGEKASPSLVGSAVLKRSFLWNWSPNPPATCFCHLVRLPGAGSWDSEYSLQDWYPLPSPRTYFLSECFPTDQLAFLLVLEEGRKWGLFQVSWLRLCTCIARAVSLILGRGTKIP